MKKGIASENAGVACRDVMITFTTQKRIKIREYVDVDLHMEIRTAKMGKGAKTCDERRPQKVCVKWT
ncbi:MAG: hypothetical protein NVS4B12_18970 [Ktedonobacteraceae bacterium]